MTKIRFILMVVVVGLFAVGCVRSSNKVQEFTLDDGTKCWFTYNAIETTNSGYTTCNWKGN